MTSDIAADFYSVITQRNERDIEREDHTHRLEKGEWLLSPV